MQPLKKRLRPDNIPSERRVMRGRTGRTIYLLLLFVFALTVGNYMFGDFFLLQADGLVLRDQHVVASTGTRNIQQMTPGVVYLLAARAHEDVGNPKIQRAGAHADAAATRLEKPSSPRRPGG